MNTPKKIIARSCTAVLGAAAVVVGYAEMAAATGVWFG